MVLLQAEKLVGSSTLPSYVTMTPTLRLMQKSTIQLSSFLRTLYLFTKNDFLTFAIPTTLFATFGALSGPVLTTNSSPNLFHILLRIPSALFMVWANLLIFDISNQRSPSAVEEDKINKPHRPLPSGRITMEATRRLLLAGIPLVLLLSLSLGCWQETLLLFTAIWMYNDLQGCDEDWILRNFFIAVGYGLYSSAALRVMAGPEHRMNEKGIQWVGLVTLVMFVTQHICDIKDAEGDRVRGRRSAPIVLGDEIVRWSVAIPVMICSVACPAFFNLGLWTHVSTFVMGLIIALRTVAYRELVSDKLTWKLWALWTCCLFALPLAKDPIAFIQVWESVKSVFCSGSECSGSLNLSAVSSVALAIEGMRLYSNTSASASDVSVPKIIVESVVL